MTLRANNLSYSSVGEITLHSSYKLLVTVVHLLLDELILDKLLRISNLYRLLEVITHHLIE